MKFWNGSGRIFGFFAIVLVITVALTFSASMAMNKDVALASASDGTKTKADHAASKRYTINDDHTVTDNLAGLTWMRCSLGQEWDGSTCSDDQAKFLWAEALQVAASHNFAGYGDWRLPTKLELETLVYCSSGQNKGRARGKLMGCAGDFKRPTIHPKAFPGTPQVWFWTAESNPNDTDYAWSIHFGHGYSLDLPKRDEHMIRLVRSTE